MNRRFFLRFCLAALASLTITTMCLTLASATEPLLCTPTIEDEMGPFYSADAPLRTSVGTGYLLFGTVKSAEDCSPISAAMIELWMTGPDGHYGEPWRATLFSSEKGTYHFTSHPPTDFGRRRAHIHMRATAEGFVPLVTQHYPLPDAGEGLFDLVLRTKIKE